jgi:hypothetical protein
MANVEFGKPRFQPPVMNDDNTSEVTAVYFAKKVLTPVYENTEEEFIAKKGEDKKTAKARFIKEKQIKKEDIVAYVPEASFEKAKGGEKVNITYKKKVRDSISFKKITKTKIKEKVWVVATCNGTTGKLAVEINENKLTNTEAVYDNPVKFLIGEEEKTKIEFEIFKDIIVTPNTYAKEITLQPKSKEDVKTLIDKFGKRTDKNAFLYFKAETIDPTYEIKIFEENKEFINKDGERLEVNIFNNGYYFNYDGTFEESSFIDETLGDKNDVYACNVSENKSIIDIKKLDIKYKKFIENASTAYGESSIGYGVVDKYELFAIASVHKRNKVAYGINSDLAIKFRGKKDEKRNKTSMIHAIAAEINTLIGGNDYSNGAKQWDGAEQTHLPTDEDSSSNGTFMFKINVMGWDINDDLYEKWNLAVSSKFNSTYFNVPQKKYAVANYGGMTNKDKIRLKSAAQYGLTMFWKEVNVSKPKEDKK